MKINDLMAIIIGNLMPIIGKEPNPKLWQIYSQLQEWKFAAEWKDNGINYERCDNLAESILKKLESLPNRKLAQQIEHTITFHQSRTLEENIAYCGRIIANWRVTESSGEIRGNTLAIDPEILNTQMLSAR